MKKTPKYLGVLLDRKLTMHEHIQATVSQASDKLNLVKWECRSDMLRTLYIGAVRSQIDYSLAVQVYGSKTALETLDRVQNQSLRLICGTFRTSPVAAAEIIANVAPLHHRRNRGILSSYEKYKRTSPGLPWRTKSDMWRGRSRLKMQSFLHTATRLERPFHR